MSTSNVNTANNSVVEPFDWDKYEGNQQDKAEAKVNNLEDEINFYKKRIELKKNDIKKLERNLRVAERHLKAAKEAQRAEKIRALLEAYDEKIVIVSSFTDEHLPARAKDIVVYQNENKCWCLKRVGEGNQWELAMEAVEDIYVRAEI